MNLNQKIKVKDIAQQFGATILGNENAEIGSINEIHKLKEDSITFVDHPKYYQKVLNSIASVIIINKEVECPEGKTLLVVENPFEVYNTLALSKRPTLFNQEKISSNATIGENTKIFPNVIIGQHVKIGKNCIIYPNVSIYDYSEIGDNVIIHANTVIGNDAYYYHGSASNGYKKMHTIGRAIVKTNVEIGALCSISSGVSGDTIIGEGTKLDSQVHVGHGTVIGANCLLAAQVGIGGKAHIEDGVLLSGKVGVAKGVTIGEKAIILASSNVSKSLKGHQTYFGSPAVLAREKWKEMAYARKLEEMWNEFSKKS